MKIETEGRYKVARTRTGVDAGSTSRVPGEIARMRLAAFASEAIHATGNLPMVYGATEGSITYDYTDERQQWHTLSFTRE